MQVRDKILGSAALFRDDGAANPDRLTSQLIELEYTGVFDIARSCPRIVDKDRHVDYTRGRAGLLNPHLMGRVTRIAYATDQLKSVG